MMEIFFHYMMIGVMILMILSVAKLMWSTARRYINGWRPWRNDEND